MNITITILIVTRNRPDALKQCLISILKNSFQRYQILVADQSDDEKTVEAVRSLHSKKIDLTKMRQKGKAKGLNLLIKKAQTEILGFTDDDCIVDKDWLRVMYDTYQNHPKIAGVFGNTYPYQSENHPGEICPALCEFDEFNTHTLIKLRYRNLLGIGNNMSLKKSVVETIGCFQEWLGPGSIGINGEETEMVFRMLKNNFTLATNPKMIIYHNRWLSYKQYRLLECRYTHGFIASLSYYLLTNDRKYAWFFIKYKIQERIVPAFHIWLQSVKTCFKESVFLFLECFSIVKGITIGLIMFIRKH